MRTEHTWLGWAVFLVSATGAAQSSPAPESRERVAIFGALFAPAALPSGSTAAYGYAGAPGIGAGFRQGLGPIELEARAEFDYFAVAGALEVAARIPVTAAGAYHVAPTLGAGVVFNSGAQWLDPHNFAYTAVRLSPAIKLSRQVAETASVLGEMTLPVDIPLSRDGGYRFQPLVGGGGEIYIGQDISAGALVQVGANVIKAPLDPLQTRFAFAVRVGIGYRFF